MNAAEAATQPGAGAGWDEAQCTAALAQLERLQQQLDGLRRTIPRIIQPLYSPPTPRMFRAYKQGLTNAQSNIKTFRNQWQAPETQAVFEHTKQSLEKNADLKASAEVPKYRWIEKEEKVERAAKRRKVSGGEAVEVHDALTQEDITRAVEEFRKTHPKIALVSKDDDHDLSMKFASDATKLQFHITISRDANAPNKLSAECLGTTEPFLTITRCIASRPQANDLKYLLDMIAAYKTVKGTLCAKCKKMFDKETMMPTARRSRKVVGPDEKVEVVWEALHEGCLD